MRCIFSSIALTKNNKTTPHLHPGRLVVLASSSYKKFVFLHFALFAANNYSCLAFLQNPNYFLTHNNNNNIQKNSNIKINTKGNSDTSNNNNNNMPRPKKKQKTNDETKVVPVNTKTKDSTKKSTKQTAKSKSSTSTSTSALSSSTSSSSSSSNLFMILSPAKTLDFSPCPLLSSNNEPIPWTTPDCDLEKTNTIKQCMQYHANASTSTSGLAKLLGISSTLAETAQEYWNDFDHQKKYSKLPCAFMYQGPAYQGLDIQSLVDSSNNNDDNNNNNNNDNTNLSSLEYLQNHLRIINPVWGWLRPMDAIPPYRLEMATKNIFLDDETKKPIKKQPKLADYWKPAIAKQLVQHCNNNKNNDENNNNNNVITIINLASDEYSIAVPMSTNDITIGNNDNDDDINNSNGITINTVKVVFKHQGRVVAVHAKRARGLFVRFMAIEKVTTLNDFLKVAPKFDLEHYKYQEKESSLSLLDENGIVAVYDRTSAPKAPPSAKAKAKAATTTKKASSAKKK